MVGVITRTDALVELNLMSLNVTEEERDAFYIKILNSDLPMEVVTRLTALWDMTKDVGGKIIHMGKLVVMEFMRFIAKFPHMSIGMAIGAVIHTLIAAIPVIGPILSPLAAVISSSIGFRLDTGRPVADSIEGTLVNTFSDVITMAKTFLEWFINLLKAAFGAVNA